MKTAVVPTTYFSAAAFDAVLKSGTPLSASLAKASWTLVSVGVVRSIKSPELTNL